MSALERADLLLVVMTFDDKVNLVMGNTAALAHLRVPSLEKVDASAGLRGDTGVDTVDLAKLGARLSTVPAGFNAHKTVKRFMDNRLASIETGEGIDWATGEALATWSSPETRRT